MDAAITDADLLEEEIDEEELALLHEAGEACLLPEDIGEEEEARLSAEAEADFAAGRYITNEQMREWLKTWGKGERVPPPQPWLK